MPRQSILAFTLAAVATMLVAVPSSAAKLSVGDHAPDWSNLPGIDDQTHGLADYKDAKLVVVAFICNHCPVSRAYEERLVALQEKYKSKDVQFIGVAVNARDDDRLPAMKVRAAEKKYNFPYLYDESQQIARDYGATVTPHVFVLDGDRKVAYFGAVDDNQNPDRATKHYLADALEALIAGNKPDPATTKEFGCGLVWK